jgi:hypothetical protein
LSPRRVCPPSYADQTASADVGSYLATVIKLDLGIQPRSQMSFLCRDIEKKQLLTEAVELEPVPGTDGVTVNDLDQEVRSSRRVCPPSYADQTASADVGSYLATVV